MSLKLLRAILTVGKFLAIVPPLDTKTQKTNFSQKLYPFIMAGCITVGLGFSMMWRLPNYLSAVTLGLVIQLLLDFTLYVSNMYTILTSHHKKHLWSKLLRNLKTLQDNNKITEDTNLKYFIWMNVFFWGSYCYMTWWGYSQMDVEFFKQLAIEYVQTYDVLIFNTLFCVSLKMLLTRYRAVGKRLQKQLSFFQKYGPGVKGQFFGASATIKNDFCRLKETADIVNGIFGWPFLFTLVFGCLQTLLYLKVVAVTHQSIASLMYLLLVIFWHYVSTYSTIIV